jgi:hypothetical protein
LYIVVKKFIAPKIEEAPAIWRLNIPKSNEGPVWPILLRGGYKVQPVPTPSPIKLDIHNKSPAGTSSQKDRLLRRGKAISGAPNRIGTTQFPNPPIRTGITKKKIIISACDVTMTLYSCVLPKNTRLPGSVSSNLINKDRRVPTIPAIKPKIRYKTPICL